MKKNQSTRWSKTFWIPFIIAFVISIALSPARAREICLGDMCITQTSLLLAIILYGCAYTITSYLYMRRMANCKGRIILALALGAIFPDIVINIFEPLTTLGVWPDLLARVGGVALGWAIYYFIFNKRSAR